MREDSEERDTEKESDRFIARAEAPNDMVRCIFCRGLAYCVITFSCDPRTASHENFTS